MELSKEQLEGLAYEPKSNPFFREVHREGEPDGKMTLWTAVFENCTNGKFYELGWSVENSSGMDSFEMDIDADWFEVEPIAVTVTSYKRV